VLRFESLRAIDKMKSCERLEKGIYMIETLRYGVMNMYSLSVCREVKNGLYRKVLQSISHSLKNELCRKVLKMKGSGRLCDIVEIPCLKLSFRNFKQIVRLLSNFEIKLI
jgi:hypothetical protein